MNANDNKSFQEYNLYVLRSHFQVRAKQKILGNELYMQKEKQNLELYKHIGCERIEEPEIKEVEKYKILLNILNPNLKDLYARIQEVCPEFTSKKQFHLYWKNSATDILPISNHITYLSMMSFIASKNNYLYLIARDWDETWLNDTAATYVSLPEDKLLVNMVARKQPVYTATQEEKVSAVKAAAATEFTRTYNPPVRPQRKSSPKGKGQKEKRPSSTKSGQKEKRPSSAKSKSPKKK